MLLSDFPFVPDSADELPHWGRGDYIYFAANIPENTIKIGRCSSLKNRIYELRISSKQYLRIMKYDTEATLIEGMVHRLFAPYRTKGEWFAAHPYLVREILEWTFMEPLRALVAEGLREKFMKGKVGLLAGMAIRAERKERERELEASAPKTRRRKLRTASTQRIAAE